MDRIIFGDNQFFGVNHMSEEKAMAQSMRFRDTESIISVLDDAYEAGIRTFMCTTHERMGEITEHFRKHPEIYKGFKFFPCMPYAHKYANAVTDYGMLGALKNYMPQNGLFDAAFKGGKALAKKDIEGVVTMLIDAEMKAFKGLDTPVILLQNVVVDLLLGLGFDEAFNIFHDYVRAEYGAEPGFITMNLPMLLERLESRGITNPIVCSSINKAGFRLSGGIEAYMRAFEEHDFRPMAMSVFASGALAPREALQWLRDVGKVESIVFGASSKEHIRSTVELTEEIWSQDKGRGEEPVGPVPSAR